MACVDVYDTGTMKQADHKFIIRPGTDGALACAIMHVLFRDRHADREGEDKYGPLTKREVQIVKLILKEHTTQEIAENLFLSIPTVETHRRNIFHKLDCRNIAGLVKYAMERGWGH